MKRNISDEVDFEVSGHVARDVGPDDRLAAAAVVEPGDLVRRDRGRIGDGRKMPGSAGIHIRVDGRKIDFVGARREVCDYVEFTWCRVADGKILEDIGSRTTCKIVGAKSSVPGKPLSKSFGSDGVPLMVMISTAMSVRLPSDTV